MKTLKIHMVKIATQLIKWYHYVIAHLKLKVDVQYSLHVVFIRYVSS